MYIFNIVALGNILYHATFSFEIFHRMVTALQMFYFVPVGYIIYAYYQDCKQPENHYAIRLRKYFPVGIALIVANLLRTWGRFIFFNSSADFFWYHFDDYLDPNKYMIF